MVMDEDVKAVAGRLKAEDFVWHLSAMKKIMLGEIVWRRVCASRLAMQTH
jgi:hypothetical protein